MQVSRFHSPASPRRLGALGRSCGFLQGPPETLGRNPRPQDPEALKLGLQTLVVPIAAVTTVVPTVIGVRILIAIDCLIGAVVLLATSVLLMLVSMLLLTLFMSLSQLLDSFVLLQDRICKLQSAEFRSVSQAASLAYGVEGRGAAQGFQHCLEYSCSSSSLSTG